MKRGIDHQLLQPSVHCAHRTASLGPKYLGREAGYRGPRVPHAAPGGRRMKLVVGNLVDWLKNKFKEPERSNETEFKRIVREHLYKLIANQESPQFKNIYLS